MLRTTFVVLAAMACVQARPQFHQFQQPKFGQFQFPNPQSSGQSTATITQGDTKTPVGSSSVTSQQAATGGQAAGGGSNVGTALTGAQSTDGIFGSVNNAKTNAESVQNGGFPGFQQPGFPLFPNPFGSATGSANSQLNQGKTVGPDGSVTTITQLGSTAGGTAEGGATSVNKATGSTSSVDGVLGSQTTSNLGAQSIQTSGR